MSEATLAPEAAMALGIASTAMPFARTAEAEAERWLRILRMHGEAGAALQALGVSEGRLVEPSPDLASTASGERVEASAERADPIARVSGEAVEIAGRRGSAGVATTDLLLAVMCVYGEDFDRVLAAHGSDRGELLSRLGVTLSPDEICGE